MPTTPTGFRPFNCFRSTPTTRAQAPTPSIDGRISATGIGQTIAVRTQSEQISSYGRRGSREEGRPRRNSLFDSRPSRRSSDSSNNGSAQSPFARLMLLGGRPVNLPEPTMPQPTGEEIENLQDQLIKAMDLHSEDQLDALNAILDNQTNPALVETAIRSCLRKSFTNTPFTRAVEQGNTNIVRMFAARAGDGAKLTSGSLFFLPLSLAIGKADLEMVRCLLELGAKPSQSDLDEVKRNIRLNNTDSKKFRNILYLLHAAREGNAGLISDSPYSLPLALAIGNADVGGVRELLELGAKPSQWDLNEVSRNIRLHNDDFGKFCHISSLISAIPTNEQRRTATAARAIWATD